MKTLTNKFFMFRNTFIDSDKVCDKTGKVLEYKEICVVAKHEALARKKACRPKLDSEGFLNSNYELIKVIELGPNWN